MLKHWIRLITFSSIMAAFTSVYAEGFGVSSCDGCQTSDKVPLFVSPPVPRPTIDLSKLPPNYGNFYFDVNAGYVIRDWDQNTGDTNIFHLNRSTSSANVQGGFSGIADVGYSIDNIWALELGYVYFPEAQAVSHTGSVQVSDQGYAVYGAVRASVPIARQTQLFGKVGEAYHFDKLNNVTDANSNTGAHYGHSLRSQNVEPMFAVGVLRKLNSYISITGMYTFLLGYHLKGTNTGLSQDDFSTPDSQVFTVGLDFSNAWIDNGMPRYLATVQNRNNYANTLYLEGNGGYAIRNWANFAGTSVFHDIYATSPTNTTGGFSAIADAGYQFARLGAAEMGYVWLPTAKATSSSAANQTGVPLNDASYSVYLAGKLIVPLYKALEFTGKAGVAWNHSVLDGSTGVGGGDIASGAQIVNDYFSPLVSIGAQYHISESWLVNAQTMMLVGYHSGSNNSSTNDFPTPDTYLFTAGVGYQFAV